MESFLNPVHVTILLSGALMLALALALLVVDFNNTLHRVFALFLMFRGLTFILALLRIQGGEAMHGFYTGLTPYLVFPGVPLAILFIYLYPKRRGIAKWRYGPAILIAVSVGLLLWYMLDHDFYGTIAPTPEGFLSTAGRGMAYVQYGPLFILNSLGWVVPGIIAFVLARDYWRSPHGSAGFSRFLVYAGFSLNALHDGTGGLLDLFFMIQSDANFPWWPFGWAQFVMPVLALPLALASLMYIHLASKGEEGTPTLQEPRRFLFYVVPLPILSALLLFHPALESRLSDALHFVLGLWRMSIPLLITYALLRFQVFGADVVIKKSVAKASLLVMFTVIFFVLLEAAESLLGDGAGFWVNIALAAFLALMATPLQGLASKAADKIMPDTKPVTEQTPDEQARFYREQFELVLEDGAVSRKDRRMLDELALSLHLTRRQQTDLEAGKEIHRASGIAMDSSGADQTLGRRQRIISAGFMALIFGAVGQGLEALVPADTFGFSLLGAGFITLAIGPVQKGVGHLLEPRHERQARRRRRTSYLAAARAAIVDGKLTAKEKRYLDRLQKELGVTRLERTHIDRIVARRAT